MACYMMLYSTFIFTILLVIPFTESSQCSKSCTFQELQLNSTIPSDFCPSIKESNTNSDQVCVVVLNIDFTRGIVNGSFSVQNQSSLIDNKIDIISHFSLNDTSIQVDIDYRCSVSDHCDMEFVHETLSPALAATQLEPLRKELAVRLYNANHTGPLECLNSGSCHSNTSVCFGTYWRAKGSHGVEYEIESGCSDLLDPLEVYWKQIYMPYNRQDSMDSGLFYCNNLKCASNTTIMETFQWLTREYILPVNVSVLNMTTTPKPTTTTTTISTTAALNYASLLCRHFKIVVPSFVIILFLYQCFF